MSRVVIDASAGVEIVLDTRRGRSLAALIPHGAEAWVPEHFFIEVLGVLRRRLLVEHAINDGQAEAGRDRLRRWHLRRAGARRLADEAWAYRHNIAMADAAYLVLADHLGAAFLTEDHKLVAAPTFPSQIQVLTLPRPT